MREQKLALKELELSFSHEKKQVEGYMGFKELNNLLPFCVKNNEVVFEKRDHSDEEKQLIKEWVKEEKNSFKKMLNNYLKKIELFKHVSTMEKVNVTSEYYREHEISGTKVVDHNLYFTSSSFDCCFLFRIHPFQTKPVIYFEPMYSNESMPVTVYIESFLSKQQTRNLWECMLKRSKHRLRLALVKEKDMDIQ